MNTYKKIVISAFSVVLAASPILVFADAGAGGGGAAGKTLPQIIEGLKNSLTGIGVSLAVIGFMVAGIMYILATTDPKKMDDAKKALVAAVIGIVIIVLSSGADTFVKSLFGI